MLTLIQIAAILQLLVAFGTPADRVQIVSDILYKTNSQVQAVPNKTVVPDAIGGVGSINQATSSVDVKVNGEDGPLTVQLNACYNGELGGYSCAKINVTWATFNVVNKGCGFTGTHDWGGYEGNNGKRPDTLTQDTTVLLQCRTENGVLSDSVRIHLIPQVQ